MVIRSVGERTTACCQRRVEREIAPAQVHLIEEKPFVSAVRKTFELGWSSGRRWTLALDADILLRTGAVQSLLARAQQEDPSVFEVQGRILDKVYGGPRDGGPHLFRTDLIPRALEAMDGAGEDLRPETFVIRQMESQGHPWSQYGEVLGLHDYEQFHVDLYRKAFLHAHKHRYDVRMLRPMWQRLGREDPDYRSLLLGLEDGRLSGASVYAKLCEDRAGIVRRLAEKNIDEKPPMGSEQAAGCCVDRLIDEHVPEPEYEAWHRGDAPPRPGMMRRFRNRLGRWMGKMA